MSRESRVLISRFIVVIMFVASVLAMALGNFFATLITISVGMIFWLLYLLAADLGRVGAGIVAETSLGKSISMVVAGLGGVLALSAFLTYGLEQTIWGGYTFHLAGVALALAVLAVMLMPLIVLELTGRRTAAPTSPSVEQAATALPEQQLYYGAPYPPDYEDYDEEDSLESEEDEDWEEEEEAQEEEEYFDEEEEDEDEDEEEEE